MDGVGGDSEHGDRVGLRDAAAGTAVLVDLDTVFADIHQNEGRTVFENFDHLATHALMTDLLADHAAKLFQSDDDAGHGEGKPVTGIMAMC